MIPAAFRRILSGVTVDAEHAATVTPPRHVSNEERAAEQLRDRQQWCEGKP